MSEYVIGLREFLSSLNWLLNLIAIGACVFSFGVLLGEGLRLRRLRRLKELRSSEGAIGLAIDVGISVTEDARLCLRRHLGEKPNGDLKVPLLLKYNKYGVLGTQGAPGHHQGDPEQDQAADDRWRGLEVHLFYGGPLSVAAALGAIIDNWVPIKWYAHNKSTAEY